MASRSRPRIVAALTVVTGLFGVAWYRAAVLSRDQAMRRYANLRACLVGPPLTATEELRSRIGAIELGLSRPEGTPVTALQQGWPGTCRVAADELVRELEAAPWDRWKTQRDVLVGRTRAPFLVEGAETPAVPPDASSSAAALVAWLVNVDAAAHGLGLTAGEAEPAWQITWATPALPGLPTEPRASTEPADTFRLACPPDGRCTLVRVGTLELPSRRMTLPAKARAELIDGVLLVQPGSEPPQSLEAADPADPFVPGHRLSPAQHLPGHPSVCRAGSHTVLVFADRATERATMYFHDGTRWSDGQQGVMPLDGAAGIERRLACDEAGASLVGADEARRLVRLRCSPAGCERTISRPQANLANLAVIGVGDQVLALRRHVDDRPFRARTSLWYRFGSLDAFDEEALLFGDRPHGGVQIGALSVAGDRGEATIAVGGVFDPTRSVFVRVDRAGVPRFRVHR